MAANGRELTQIIGWLAGRLLVAEVPVTLLGSRGSVAFELSSEIMIKIEFKMTNREALHQLVDELPEEQAELARIWLEDLRGAADENGPPLDAEALASLDRGIADTAAGRVTSLDVYERDRGL